MPTLESPKVPLGERRAEVRARLARAHGHLHGVVDMLDDGREYTEILQQIAAIRAALEKATAVALDDMITSTERAPRSAMKDAFKELRVAVKTLA